MSLPAPRRICSPLTGGVCDKAVNYFNNAIKKNPKYAKAYYMLARTYTKKARFTDAIDNAKSAIKYAPLTSSSAHHLLYNLYQVSSFRIFKNKIKSYYEYVLAILTLPFDSEAIARVKESFNYIKFLPILLKGYIKMNSGGLDNALDVYIDAINKAPGFVPLYCLLGDIYSSLGKFEDAITEYKMAIWLDSLNIPAYRHLCQAYEDMGDSVGDVNKGLDIPNQYLYKLENAPICRHCDACQCKRCVWLNRKMTLEVNTPSHEQCVAAHLERNASRQLQKNIRKYGEFLPEIDEIKEIDYLDPFNNKEKWQ